MMEKTVTLGEVDDVDVDRFQEVARVLHSKVEPLKISSTIAIVAHEAVEGLIGPSAYLVEVSALKVCIESHWGALDCVQRHLLALCVSHMVGRRPCIH